MKAWFSRVDAPPQLVVPEPCVYPQTDVYPPEIIRQLAIARALGTLSGSRRVIHRPEAFRVIPVEKDPCIIGVLGLERPDGPFVVAALSRARSPYALLDVDTHLVVPGQEADCARDGCVHMEVSEEKLAVRGYVKGERVTRCNDREADEVLGRVVAALTIEGQAVRLSSCRPEEIKYLHLMEDSGHTRMPEPAAAAVDMVLGQY